MANSKNTVRNALNTRGTFLPASCDNLAFSRDEPVVKLPKGVLNSKVPKRAKVKRKFDDNTDDFERDERRAYEPVVKQPKYKWDSFSQ